MSSMSHQTAAPDEFGAIASGTVRAFVQLQSHGSAVIYVGDESPGPTEFVGVILETGEATEVSFDNLEVGDVVYARALSEEPVRLLVMVASEAPA